MLRLVRDFFVCRGSCCRPDAASGAMGNPCWENGPCLLLLQVHQPSSPILCIPAASSISVVKFALLPNPLFRPDSLMLARPRAAENLMLPPVRWKVWKGERHATRARSRASVVSLFGCSLFLCFTDRATHVLHSEARGTTVTRPNYSAGGDSADPQ